MRRNIRPVSCQKRIFPSGIVAPYRRRCLAPPQSTGLRNSQFRSSAAQTRHKGPSGELILPTVTKYHRAPNNMAFQDRHEQRTASHGEYDCPLVVPFYDRNHCIAGTPKKLGALQENVYAEYRSASPFTRPASVTRVPATALRRSPRSLRLLHTAADVM